MKVNEIMSKDVAFIKPEASLRQAARKMKELGVGTLPIVQEGRLLGIITDRDISCHAVAMGRDPNSTEVQKVMTRDVATCLDDLEVDAAASLMSEHHIRRLAVLDQQQQLAGVLSVDDLVRASRDLAGAVLASASLNH